MEPISNADRLVLLLRQKLLERSKATVSTSRPSHDTAAGEQAATGLDNVQALAAVEGVDDRQLGRALVQSILTDEFGASLVNEAKFQQVVDRVTEALQSEAGSSRLLARLLTELRASAAPA